MTPKVQVGCGNRKQPVVLMVGAVPPPTGGIATQVDLLLSSSLGRRYRLLLFDPELPVVRSGARPPVVLRLIASARMFVRFAIMLRSESVQITHLHASSFPGVYEKALMGVLARLMRRRVVLQLHSGVFETVWRTSRFGAGVAAALQAPNAVTVQSTEWVRTVSQIAPRAHPYFVPSCIRTDRYPATIRESGQVVRFLFVGWIIREKGIFELAEAVARMPKDSPAFEIHVVGDGVDKEMLEERVAKLDLAKTVTIHGWVDEAEKHRLIQSADVFVLPTYSEGMPVALLEAMAAGLAVITTPVGAIPGLVTSGVHGELVQPRDVDGLARALDRLCRDHELRARYGKASAERARSQYDVESGATAIAAIYETLLSNAPRTRCK